MLPKQLTSLNLSFCFEVTGFCNFSANLINVFTIDKGLLSNPLPKDLKSLSLSFCSLDEYEFLQVLPKGLTHLDISGTIGEREITLVYKISNYLLNTKGNPKLVDLTANT